MESTQAGVDTTRQQDARRRATVVGISERLVAQAEKTLRRQLADNPDSASRWRRLADTQRMLGQLDAARDSYRHALALAPDPDVKWALSVLGPGELPAPPAGERAAPFTRLADFLTRQEQQSLWSTTLAAGYLPARIGGDNVDSSRRSAAVARPLNSRSVKRWFVPKLRTALAAALVRLGPDCRGLRGEDVGDYGFECDVTAHHAGDYYTCHADTMDPRDASHEEAWRSARRISYVYYFHRQPRRFSGGDLLLYDTDYDAGKTSMRAYTRLPVADNTVVLFPSNSYHEITKVLPTDGETLAFADGRFTVNGWIHPHKLHQPPA